MKKVLLLLVACSLFAVSACRKELDHLPNPLKSDDYQVAEYHKDTYEADLGVNFPFLFRKIYDSHGAVKEIDFSYREAIPFPQQLLQYFYHTLRVETKGRKVYLTNTMTAKGATPDTVAVITLNEKGRAISCWASTELDLHGHGQPVVQYFTYSHDRISVVRTDFECCDPKPFIIDTVHYDGYGNVIAFSQTTFQYDYSKKPRQQFYCDDFEENEEPFYLLLYLGYFPEFSSPVNLRTFTNAVVNVGPITDHKFDAQGRLISYTFDFAPVTITWR